MPREKHPHNLYQDVGIVLLSILLAFVIARLGAVEVILSRIGEARLIGSFFSGIMFTFVFTSAPAAVLLGELAQANSAWAVALTGALGAVSGDYIIFRFVRDRFSEEILELLRRRRRLTTILRLRSARWVLGAVGMLILASPLPDELGVTLLGFLKTKPTLFFLLSFTANFLGILAIGLAAQSLE